MRELFAKHISQRLDEVSQIMEDQKFDSLVIETGFPEYYYLDDQTSFFKPNPHFMFFCPDMGEGHILVLNKGKKPKLFYYIPSDFWHETSELKGEFWEEFFDIEIFDDHEAVWKQIISSAKKQVVISPHPEEAHARGCIIASDQLLNQVHWLRVSKTPYEIECIRIANKNASLGHRAAREAFLSGDSELGVFFQYLMATRQKESQLPYSSIVAFNEKSAVLHYQHARDERKGQTFLIDAGFRFQGYCADITRTHFQAGVHPIFESLHKSVDNLQKSLCQLVRPQADYLNIQDETHVGIAKILIEHKVLNCSFDEAVENKFVHPFFPHGVGHALGLQVHDVGGKQVNESKKSSESEDHPFLRTLRTIQSNDVLTIEPGLYMIPALLTAFRSGNYSDKFNWKLIDELSLLGGIRIEDNIVATTDGPKNLTREFLPQ